MDTETLKGMVNSVDIQDFDLAIEFMKANGWTKILVEAFMENNMDNGKYMVAYLTNNSGKDFSVIRYSISLEPWTLRPKVDMPLYQMKDFSSDKTIKVDHKKWTYKR